ADPSGASIARTSARSPGRTAPSSLPATSEASRRAWLLPGRGSASLLREVALKESGPSTRSPAWRVPLNTHAHSSGDPPPLFPPHGHGHGRIAALPGDPPRASRGGAGNS